MNVLYNTINKIAEATYPKEVTVEAYKEWVEHWLNTARALRRKCEQEGLTSTVIELDMIIREQTLIGME